MCRSLRLWIACLLVLTLPLKGLAASGWMLGCAGGHGLPPAATAGGHGHDHDHAHQAHHAAADESAGSVDCSHCAPCSMVAAPATADIVLPQMPAGRAGLALGDGRHASADSDVPLRPPRSALA